MWLKVHMDMDDLIKWHVMGCSELAKLYPSIRFKMWHMP